MTILTTTPEHSALDFQETQLKYRSICKNQGERCDRRYFPHVSIESSLLKTHHTNLLFKHEKEPFVDRNIGCSNIANHIDIT